MPTLPLYTSSPAHPDGSHAVAAPGGYEWWYFDAEDSANDIQIVGIVFNGFVFHPGYLRRHFRYLRRATRHAPPLPDEYPCAYFVTYERGKILTQFMSEYAPGSLRAAADELRVELGPNRIAAQSDGIQLDLSGHPWELTMGGPKTLTDRVLRASIHFRPRIAGVPRPLAFLSRALSGADHHWIIANPLCDVRGRIETGGGRTIDLSGRGYHDHNFGSGPIGPGLKRWFWGRVLMEDAACTFHFTQARDRALPDEVHFVEADVEGVRQPAIERITAEWSGRTALRLAYPKRIDFGEMLRLSEPRVVDSAPFYLRILYQARWRGRDGRAFCEVAYPHRLRWPILGRMIEMSIHRPQV